VKRKEKRGSEENNKVKEEGAKTERTLTKVNSLP